MRDDDRRRAADVRRLTAGRLTVRELTKCLTGQDCFGPNNEIVKAFNTVGNDLKNGLGESNDLVVATKPIVEGVKHFTNEVAKVEQQIRQGAGQVVRSIPVVGPVLCGIFGC